MESREKLVKINRLIDDADFKIRWQGCEINCEKYTKGPTYMKKMNIMGEKMGISGDVKTIKKVKMKSLELK